MKGVWLGVCYGFGVNAIISLWQIKIDWFHFDVVIAGIGFMLFKLTLLEEKLKIKQSKGETI